MMRIKPLRPPANIEMEFSIELIVLEEKLLMGKTYMHAYATITITNNNNNNKNS